MARESRGAAALATVAIVVAILGGLGAGFILQGRSPETDAPAGHKASIETAAPDPTSAPVPTRVVAPSPAFVTSSAAAVTPAPPAFLGGIWASPSEGDTVTNDLELRAVPFSGQPDTPVYEVTFTMTWASRPYSNRGCTATAPSSGTEWHCTAHPATFGAPPGDLILSFDVSDGNGHEAESPNGTRTVSLLPTPAPAGWTKPQLVDASSCSTLAATIDASSGYHVATECDGRVRYSASHGDAGWATRPFARPARRLELNPQIAVDGDLAYVAFTRVAVTEGGCGDNGLRDVGVYYRVRTLPDGRWSAATRIGEIEDHIESFRVVGGALHATVKASDGLVYYETVTGTSEQRYLVPGAVGASSLRVGNDGLARIAYETANAVRYAVFDGGGFSTSPIPGSSRGLGGFAPSLVLGAENDAHVVWTLADHGLGCAGIGPSPEDGTYYSTNASGRWVTERLTTDVDTASLTLDVATGRVHVVVSGFGSGLDYYTKSTGGDWSRTSLLVESVRSPLIRLDPASGTLLVVYIGVGDTGNEGIYALTKP